MKRNAFFLWLLLLFFTLLMVGCNKENTSISESTKHQNQKVEMDSPILTVEDIKENVPIPIEEGEFERVYGWIDGQTIVY